MPTLWDAKELPGIVSLVPGSLSSGEAPTHQAQTSAPMPLQLISRWTRPKLPSCLWALSGKCTSKRSDHGDPGEYAMNLSDLLDDAADYSDDLTKVRIYLARRLDAQGKELMPGKVQRDDIGMVIPEDAYDELHLVPMDICGDHGQYTANSFALMVETEPGLMTHELMARIREIRRPGSDAIAYTATPIVGSVCFKEEDGMLEMWLLLFPPEQWDHYFRKSPPLSASPAASPPSSDGSG